MAPRLAVCIPVHHGRVAPLGELLGRLVPQLPGDGSVELCVADNASRDGTEELIIRLASDLGAERVRYLRHASDRGLVENLLSVVELATAEYCWLLGSDDAPTPDSVAGILELLGRHPGVTGLSLGFYRRAGDDLERPGADLNLLPATPGEARLRASEEFARACGLLTLPLSCNVIHRERWRRVVASERGAAERTPIVPQVYITARMVERDPDWLWAERRLVLLREAPVFLEEEDQLGANVGRTLRAITGDLDRAWANLFGRGSDVHELLRERLWRYLWHPAALAPLKQMYSAGIRDDLAFFGITRHFWRSRAFRRQVLPLLLMPTSRMRLEGGIWEPPATMRAELAGRLPERMVAARGAWVSAQVMNRGGDRLSYGPQHHLALFARWRDASGVEVPARIGHTPLVPSLRPGRTRAHDVFLTVPDRGGSYELEIDLLSATQAWSATRGRPLCATVEVLDP